MAIMQDEENATVIGESVTVRGNLSGDEDLYVYGRVEGSVELDRTLVVAESGIVKAEVAVKNAVISGIVVGNITASDSVEITEQGRMVGDINAPRVIVVDGASFRGNIDMGDMESLPRPQRRQQPATEPTRRPAASTPAPAKTSTAPRAAAPVEDEDEEEAPEPRAAPSRETPRPAPSREPSRPMERPSMGSSVGMKKPSFLEPPKAKGLKKKQTRVVVKRK